MGRAVMPRHGASAIRTVTPDAIVSWGCRPSRRGQATCSSSKRHSTGRSPAHKLTKQRILNTTGLDELYFNIT